MQVMSNGTSQPLRGPPIDAEMETQLLKWEEDMKATEILEREHRVIERVGAACAACGAYHLNDVMFPFKNLRGLHVFLPV